MNKIQEKYSSGELFSLLHAYLSFYNKEFIYQGDVELIQVEGDEVVFAMSRHYEKLRVSIKNLEHFKFVLEGKQRPTFQKLMEKEQISKKLHSVLLDLQMYLQENREGTRGFAVGSAIEKVKRAIEIVNYTTF